MRTYIRSMMRLFTIVPLLALSLIATVPIARGDQPPPYRSMLYRPMIEAARQAQTAALAAANPRATNSRSLTLVGSLALPGFNADVWAHKGFAYVGTWGAGPDACPATGVRIIDLDEPNDPTLVGAVAAIPDSTQEDVEVTRVNTRFFHGDLLVTGIQSCSDVGPQGIDIWDVTDPRHPQHLGFWDSIGAFGVHELDLFQRGNRVFVAAATPFAEFAIGEGDFRLVEVTDPRHPVQVGEWGLSDIGTKPNCDDFAQFCTFDHSVTVNENGKMAILSYWDFGAVFLDISDPAHPTFVGRTVYPTGADGDTHSVALARGDNLLLTADEDFSPGEILNPPPDDTWGFLRIWNVKNPAAPVEIGRFSTANSLSTRSDGFYSIHNPVVRGNTAYLSWYTDGVRVVDISRPRAPREIASFVPPGVEDPFGFFPPVPIVWGVVVERDLILLSDMNAGLYVLKQKHAE